MTNRTFPGLPLLLLVFLCMPGLLWSQVNIPLESWRSHFSYRSANSLAINQQRAYAASRNGLFYLDKEDNSITILTSQQGLSDAGISKLSFSEDKNLLLIAYRNGNLDLVQDGKVTNINTIFNATRPGQRKINDLLFKGAVAYLSTDYGISVLDLASSEIKESYLNLGEGGLEAEVFKIAIWNDSIFAATDLGLIANALEGANLSDFRSWKRYSEAAFPVSGEVRTLASSAKGLFAGVDGQGLLNYKSGEWQETAFSTDKEFRAINTVNDQLLVSLIDAVYLYNSANGSYEQISSPLIVAPQEATIDENGIFWIADARNGLISDFEGAFKAYVPNGPLADVAEKLYAGNDKIIAVYNQPPEVAGAQASPGGFSVFAGGSWTNFPSDEIPGVPGVNGFSDVVYTAVNKRYYFSSLSGGLFEWDPENSTFRQFTAGMEGVSLQSASSGQTAVSTLSADEQGNIWMVQPGEGTPLHRYNPSTGEWKGYLVNNKLAGLAGEILVLPENNVWLQLKGESSGVLLFNEESGKVRRLVGQNLNNIGGNVLIHKEATSMALDLEGLLWVGMGKGINYLTDPYHAMEEDVVSVIFPRYEGMALLNSEAVSSLAVDGANRKWVGTTSGLWVVGDYGDTIYHHFTKATTPLPDNHILSQAILQQSGEVFIATSGGMVSYRSGATAAAFQHEEAIKVYPNPVYPGYSGKVGITGLASDVYIKITDVSGKLVKELVSEGGTATWDLSDTRGKRPATGVYLIFSTTQDGVETLAGKMAVIN